jgi:hypothetical protein
MFFDLCYQKTFQDLRAYVVPTLEFHTVAMLVLLMLSKAPVYNNLDCHGTPTYMTFHRKLLYGSVVIRKYLYFLIK